MIEVFGITTGFKFSWYIHGPYNRGLTAVMYNDPGADFETSELTSDDKKHLKELKNYLGSDIKSSRVLELIGSLHFLMTVSKKKNMTKNEIITNFLKIKPQFNRNEVEYHFNEIEKTLF